MTKGFPTFIVEKVNNELKNIFLNDKGNNLRNLSSNATETNETTIIAENGIIEEKNYIYSMVKLFHQEKNLKMKL